MRAQHEKAWAAWRDVQHVLDVSPDNSLVDKQGDRVFFTKPEQMRGGMLGGDLYSSHPHRGFVPCGTYRIDKHGNLSVDPRSIAEEIKIRLDERAREIARHGSDPFVFNWDED